MQSTNYPRAKQVLQSLISGADPATGCDLPKDSILNRVDVIRAPFEPSRHVFNVLV
jgi:hypothetical protein